MSFARPEWLNALFLIPLLAGLFLFGARRRRCTLVEFAGGALSDSLAPGRSWRKGLLKAFLRVGGFTLLVLALAGPQFGSQLVKVEREGIDLVIALDTSYSMLAEDMKPNRLERAKQEIIDFIQGLKGDRVGVVVFAGDAFVLCPLTVDYDAALMLVQTADVSVVSEPGTALDKAIEKSVGLFPESGKADRVVVLVTDGEGHEGDPVGAAEKAAQQGVRIYAIGIGSPQGELIPLRGTDGAVTGYKKDESGGTVLTRLDEATLQRVARATKGEYFPATRQGLELKALYREISGLEKAAIKGEFVERKRERFAWFLLGAFVLLGLDACTLPRGSMRRGAKGRILHTGAAGACILALLTAAPQGAAAKGIDRGRVKSGNEYYRSGEYQKALTLYREALGDTTKTPKYAEDVRYNEANALHMMQRYPEALAKYEQSVSEDTVQAGRTFYNRANTLVKMGKLPEAVESYVQALQYMPDDPDARHNLELALRMMQQQQQNQQQEQDQNGDGSGKKQQQKQDKGEQGSQNQQKQESPQRADSTQSQPRPQLSEQDSTTAQPQMPDSVKMSGLSREDALRLLRLLEEQEKELQKEKRKAAFIRVRRSGKDW